MKLKALVITLALTALLSYSLAPNTMAVPSGPCPISLTNPDGQALTLEKYDLRVAVNGPLSLTEMEMVFHNPEQRQMEGRFLYLLPPGATISRFAKEVNGNLMEGEVVERMRAQAVYTQILHTMRDPALLEMDQGNRFSARVFPIPGNGTVRLLLSYSQLVPMKNGERKITVPLAGLPKIGDFSVSVDIREASGAPECSSNLVKGLNAAGNRSNGSFKSGDFTSQTDLELTIKPGNAGPLSAISAGNFQMLTYSAPAAEKTARLEQSPDWVFYFDTSASNADMEKRRLSAIDALLVGLVPKIREQDKSFSAFAFDVNTAEIMKPVSMNADGGGPLMPRVVNALRARHALGATNLEAVLKQIGEQARAAKNAQRFILVSDGIATLGAREPREILAALGEWPAQHVLHALVIGSKQDEKMLAAITEKTNGRVVTLPLGEDMETQIAKTISDLTEPLGTTYEFYDEGAVWIYPKLFHDVRPGSELVVFSQLKDKDLKQDTTSKPGVVTRAAGQKLVDTPLKVTPAELPDFAPLLQREANAAFLSHLEKLEQTENDVKKRLELRKQRIDVSVKNRVLCPLTSLLVLESDRDYRRFGIDRTAMTDILAIGANGIELKHRATPEKATPPAQPSTPADPRAETQKAEPASNTKKSAGEKEAKFDSSDKTKALSEDAADEKAKDSPFNDHPDAAPASGRAFRAVAGEEQTLSRRGHDARIQLESAEVGQAGGGSSSSSGGGADRELGGADRQLDNRYGPNAQTAQNGQLERSTNGARSREATAAELPVFDSGAHEPNRPAPAISRDGEAQIDDGRNDQTTGSLRPQAGQSGQAGKGKGPAWVSQLSQIPTADQIGALHAQVSANPRNRGLRNAYAQTLLNAKWDELQGQAFEWLPFDPENPQVYEYLGKSATGLKDPELALRAMTSIAEIAPNRAALLARAGWLLLTTEKYEMAQQMFREALKNRQDDCNIYRGLALSLWLDGKFEDSAKILDEAIKKGFDQRYGDTKRVLKEELGYVLRAWSASGAAEPAMSFAQKNGVTREMKESDALRVTMCWETDANDVDLHVVDPSGEECWYSHKNNKSGLELYSDQTQGLGPEVIRTDKALDGTYSVAVNYFAAGPMGVSRGVVVMMQPNAEGLVKQPTIVPFCLIPGGPDMRLIGTVNFGAEPQPKPEK